MKIEIELRPCLVYGEKALFHKWGNGIINENQPITVGIIEFEKGNIDLVDPNEIKFMDNKHLQYIW